MLLDDRLLYAFMNSFFGYGNLGADLWFVGMEEGGGKTETEIQNRLAAWASRGRREVEDAAEFHQASGMGTLFNGTGRVQRSWEQLIRTIFAIQGRTATSPHLRSFQNFSFGRCGGCAAFLEMLPLPSPTSKTWNYGAGRGEPKRPWTKLPVLRLRSTYEKAFRDSRSARLRQLIGFHRPKAVIFYGISNRVHFGAVSNATFQFPRRPEAVCGTSYMLLVHPAYRYGNTQQIYFEAGKSLQRIGVRC